MSLIVALLTAGLTLTAPPAVEAPRPDPAIRAARTAHAGDVCVASFYGEAFRGRPTASGRLFDPDTMVAAHRSLPFGTRLAVEHAGRQVVVEIVDRGPFVAGRCLDLSASAFARLAAPGAGTIPVRLVTLDEGRTARAY